MTDEASRRGFLAALGAAGLAGCQQLGGQKTVQQSPRRDQRVIIEADDTSIRVSNETLSLRLDRTVLSNIVAFHTAGTRSSPDYLAPIRARPKTPVSQTESRTPDFHDVRTLDRIEQASVAGYDLRRRYQLAGTPVTIAWRVLVPTGHHFVVLRLSITNTGDSPLELDQDEGDTHAGIQTFSRLRLPNRTRDDSEYRFAHPVAGINRFSKQPVWRTYPTTRWVSLFDDKAGATFGYVAGTTAPKMVVNGGSHLDFLVNETILAPDETIRYWQVVCLHPDATNHVRIGRRKYREAAQWVRQWKRSTR